MSDQETIAVVNAILNGPFVVVSIFANALVLTAVRRTPAMKSRPSMFILCSLALSDLLVGLIAQPIYIAKELSKDPSLQKIWNTLGNSLCGVSMGLITAKSIDRFMAVHYHLRYSALVTISRTRFTVAIIWCVSFALSGVYFWHIFWYEILVIMNTGICLFISTFSYVGIYRVVRRHYFRMRTQNAAVDVDGNENLRMKQLVKSTVNTFVFHISMLACYFPMYILLFLYSASSSYNLWRKEWNFSVTLLLVNSSVNPFLYYWRLRDLRLAIKEIINMLLCRRTPAVNSTSIKP
ncbi:adenosine receptor A2b-like [Montipora capricornis]|uniref:adenosine receptor A2b-like n=1 Tax=Montipora foliosa TaxID=591990 RepID=UPI0035F1CE62